MFVSTFCVLCSNLQSAARPHLVCAVRNVPTHQVNPCLPSEGLDLELQGEHVIFLSAVQFRARERTISLQCS